MFSKLVMDSDSANVTNICDQRKTSKSSHIMHTLGYIPSNTPVEDHEDIVLKNSCFTPRYFPFNHQWPNRILISGMTMAGKSYFASMIVRSYKKQNKDNDVFIFSNLDSDPVLDRYKPTRIELSEDLVEDPIELEELANSLCIFDDIDSITDKAIYKAVHELRDQIFATGRHHQIACITISQLLLKGFESKQSIENANLIVLFPGASRHQVFTFFKEKMHYDNEIIKKICNLKTRWICFHKCAPAFILYETGFFFL